jgi:cytochrome c-type biogenesis protein CcmE
MNWQPRHTRIALIVFALLSTGIAVALVLTALSEKVTYFYSPTALFEKQAQLLAEKKNIRLGGLVEKGSVTKDGPVLSFVVTDMARSIRVTYRGLPPDLFREGQGVVAEGELVSAELFEARTLLAKHDENYMPPEVAKALKKQEMDIREGLQK